jgi:hypothetical protein
MLPSTPPRVPAAPPRFASRERYLADRVACRALWPACNAWLGLLRATGAHIAPIDATRLAMISTASRPLVIGGKANSL